jgi:large subunit ribosomal protein L9
MEVILKENVKHLGYKDDVVKVKSGYGRNYLIPKKLADLATSSTKKVLNETIKQRAFKDQKIKTAAEETAAKLKDMVVKVGAKAGDTGKIFGSVTTVQIADAIKKLGHDVDRRSISLSNDAIKELGTYTAEIRLHKEVIATLSFEVVQE